MIARLLTRFIVWAHRALSDHGDGSDHTWLPGPLDGQKRCQCGDVMDPAEERQLW